MGPRSTFEVGAALFVLIALTIFNAALFGEIAVISEVASRKRNEFQEQIDCTNTAMRIIEVPYEL